MNRQEQILIDSFLNKDDKVCQHRAYNLLFWEGKEIPGRIDAALRTKFSGRRYRDREEDLKRILVGFLSEELIRKDRKTFDSVDYLPGWMYTTACNCAERNRDRIDDALGFVKSELPEDESKPVSIDDALSRKVADADGYGGGYGAAVIFEPVEEPSSQWAEDLIGSLINRIPNEGYRNVLRAVDLEGVAVKDYAEDLGKTQNAGNSLHNDAILELIRVALPEIRRRMRSMYERYGDLLKPADQEVLGAFFSGGSPTGGRKTAESYARLLKISRRETALEEKEEAKEAREEKRRIKEREAEEKTRRKAAKERRTARTSGEK